MTVSRRQLTLAAVITALVVAGVALIVVGISGSSRLPEQATVKTGVLHNLAALDNPEPAPDIAFKVKGGRSATLADYRGRVIVLNFWATWCPPCRKEMPSLDRLAAHYGGHDLVVMTMSVDHGDESRIRTFYKEIGASHLGIYRDPDMKLAHRLHVVGLPTTLLVDARGRIVAQLVGTAEWDSPAAIEALTPLVQAARQARLGTTQQAQAE